MTAPLYFPDMGLTQKTIMREWLVLALSLAFGAHVALGFLLHGSLGWRTEEFGFYGIIFGVGVYVVVQVIRSVWWRCKGREQS